jgi:hypothetical protein
VLRLFVYQMDGHDNISAIKILEKIREQQQQLMIFFEA